MATFTAETTTFETVDEAEVVVTIENRGQSPEVFNLFVTRSPILFLDVRRPGRLRRRTPGPPPTPPPPEVMEAETVTLQPGEQRSVPLSLSSMFSPELRRGTYLIRARRMPSNVLRIRIRRSVRYD